MQSKNKEYLCPYPYNLLEDIYGEPYEKTVDDDIAKGIDYALSKLSTRTQECIKAYYVQDLTYEQIASLQRVTKERIRQIVLKGLRLLRHPSLLKYIERGYTAVSGELRAVIEQRYAKTIETLEQEYIAKIRELSEKISDANYLLSEFTKVEAAEFIDKIEIPIENLDLSIRSFNCLHRAGIKKLAQLCTYSIEDLQGVRNLGRKSCEEIVSKMSEYGLKLKGEK